MDYQEVDLKTINSGAAFDLFEEQLRKVLENIADPNTPPEAVREIRLVVKIKPTEDRAKAATTVQATAKLAATKPHDSFVILGTDGQRIHAYTTNPKQNVLDLDEARAQQGGTGGA